jgi:hypothetical protein
MEVSCMEQALSAGGASAPPTFVATEWLDDGVPSVADRFTIHPSLAIATETIRHG